MSYGRGASLDEALPHQQTSAESPGGIVPPPNSSEANRRAAHARHGGITNFLFRNSSSELSYDWSERENHYIRDRVRECFSKLVLQESNLFARLWQVIVSFFLFYTATVFPYYLCFYHFRTPETETPYEDDLWTVIEWLVDIVFWVDLLLGFITTFRDERGIEVVEPGPILRNYLRGAFWINLPACVPLPLVELIIESADSSNEDGQSGLNRATQLTRLQRIARLARLVRLLRLLKVLPILLKNAKVRRWRSSREMRILSSLAYLLFFVHLLACGWYLCAFFHEEDTFLERRELPDGQTLLDQPAGVQWAHSMYFVLSVFTTVGFGDIHARSSGEVVYACVTMMTGVILNALIVSEMITILTRIDEAADKVNKLKEHVSAFAEHTELDEASRLAIFKVLENSRKVHSNFDREQIAQLLQTVILPLPVAEKLPEWIHGGRLLQNRFLSILSTNIVKLPPRLVALLAAGLTEQQTTGGEFVYRCHEHPVSLFIVFEGCYACVAYPTTQGAAVEPAPVVISAGKAFNQLQHIRAFQPLMQRLPDFKGDLEQPAESGGSSRYLLQTAQNAIQHYAPRPMLINPWKHTEDQAARVEPNSPGAASYGPSQKSLNSGSPLPASPGFRRRLRKYWFDTPPNGAGSGSAGALADGDSHPASGGSPSVLSSSPRNFSTPRNRRVHSLSLSSGYESQNSMLPMPNAGQPQLYPFKLYSFGTYFGETELLVDEPRKFSVRCEGRKGTLMVLRKADFYSLMRDYPQYGNMWRKLAFRRESMRMALASGLTYGMRYKHLAAVILQQWWRTMRKIWKTRGAELVPKLHEDTQREEEESKAGVSAAAGEFSELLIDLKPSDSLQLSNPQASSSIQLSSHNGSNVGKFPSEQPQEEPFQSLCEAPLPSEKTVPEEKCIDDSKPAALEYQRVEGPSPSEPDADASEELLQLKQALHSIRSSQQSLQNKVILTRTILAKTESELRRLDLL